MINRLKKGIMVCAIFFLIGVLFANVVIAASLSFSESVNLTVGSETLTVAGGSSADQIDIYSDHLDVVISSDSSIEISSPAIKKISTSPYSLLVDNTCDDDNSKVLISGPESGTVTISLTIEDTVCKTISGGGITPPPVVEPPSPEPPPVVEPPTPEPPPIVEPPPSEPPPVEPPPVIYSGGGGTGKGVFGGGIMPQEPIEEPNVKETSVQIRETVKEKISETYTKTEESVKKTAVEVKRTFNTPTGKTASKVAIGVSSGVALAEGVVAATAVPHLLSLKDLFLLLTRAIGLFGELLGIKKKKRKWGIVYDSKTKRPLDPAYVVLKDESGEEVDYKVTDMDGRFGFLTPPGKFRIEANKTNYVFPSKALFGKSDDLYDNLYYGEVLNVEQPDIIKVNIPMDSVGIDWNEEAKKKMTPFNLKKEVIKKRAMAVLFWGGLVVSSLSYWSFPVRMNLWVLVGYITLVVFRQLGFKSKSYGKIIDKETGKPIPFARIKLSLKDMPDISIGVFVADILGRYYMLIVGPGQYLLKISGETIDGRKIETEILQEAKGKILNKDIKV